MTFIRVFRWSSSTSMPFREGSRCCTTTNAMPLFSGTCVRKRSNASRPPADAPMPTTGNGLAGPRLGSKGASASAVTWPGVTWPGVTWPGVTWPGVTWPGVTWPTSAGGRTDFFALVGAAGSNSPRGLARSPFVFDPFFTMDLSQKATYRIGTGPPSTVTVEATRATTLVAAQRG